MAAAFPYLPELVSPDGTNNSRALDGERHGSPSFGAFEELRTEFVLDPVYLVDKRELLILDGPTLGGIFSGTITRWDDPAIKALNPNSPIPAQPIMVVFRSDESGTTDNFQQYLQTASGGSWTRGAGKTFNGAAGQSAPGNKGTAEMVKNTPGTITYNEWSSAIDQNLATADIKTPAGITHIGTDWDSRSIAPVTITGQGNNLVLDMTPAYQPAAKFGYPILLVGYAIVCSRYPDSSTGEAVRSFLQSAVTVGQTDLNKVGYIPLPTEFQTKAADAIKSIP